MRGRIVTPETAPAMAEVRDKGVNFKKSTLAVPTVHHGERIDHGDRGIISADTEPSATRSIPVIHRAAGDTVVPFIENDAVLGDVDEHFGGDYLNEETILKRRARRASARQRSQSRSDASVRPYRRADRPAALDRDRRFHRR